MKVAVGAVVPTEVMVCRLTFINVPNLTNEFPDENTQIWKQKQIHPYMVVTNCSTSTPNTHSPMVGSVWLTWVPNLTR